MLPRAKSVCPDRLSRLHQAREALARAPGIAQALPHVSPLEVPAIDHALGGGLQGGALHEIAARREGEIAAASSFVLMLSTLRPKDPRRNVADARAIVWVATDRAAIESGLPYGPGLDGCGIPPERLLTVAAAKTRDVLWVMEEALRCGAVAAVIGEIRSQDSAPDLVATRRLSLAAAHGGAFAFLLRTQPGREPSAAATRWIIGAARSATSSLASRHNAASLVPGPSRLDVRLMRNRRGNLGEWLLELDHEQRFVLACAHPQPVASPFADGPHRTAKSA